MSAPVAEAQAIAAARRLPEDAADGQWPGLYAALGRIGPATVYGLAREAQLSVVIAYRWLARQVEAGRVHRDQADGRYALWLDLWCEWPRSEVREGGLQ